MKVTDGESFTRNKNRSSQGLELFKQWRLHQCFNFSTWCWSSHEIWQHWSGWKYKFQWKNI